jgi:hypothetical protein
MQWFSVQRQTGTPQIAGFYTLTGESLVVRARWPGGGFVWNTPLVIHVQRRGHTVTHRVLDMTRLAQFGLAVASIWMIVLLGQKRKEGSDE